MFNCVGELFVDIAFYENVAMAIAVSQIAIRITSAKILDFILLLLF
ncbi:hypothetical protein [Nostoc sp. CHAB 5715]|nr:hypothetical protein [Nostoc sp. CHAB 5715]MCC5626509.1 hypothetical protein [Nostoc sp. CHAB 5715]